MALLIAPDQDLVWRQKVQLTPMALALQTDLFFAAALQVVFVLSLLPADPPNMVMSVNGQVQTQVLDYTIAGAVLTWLDTDFVLDAGDEVIFFYEV